MNRRLRAPLRHPRRAGLLLSVLGLIALELLGRVGAAMADGELVEPPDFPDDPIVRVVEAVGAGGAGEPGRRRLTEAAAEAMHQRSWSVPAADDTWRVVALGDSTVYGPFPETLEAGLRIPGRAVEVLNFGMIGAVSLNVRSLIEVALAQEPELILVYVGHNETLGLRSEPINRQSFRARAASSRLVHSGLGWLARLPMLLLDEEEDQLEHFEDACAEGACGPLTDEEWASVAPIYARNLEETCALAGDAGVPVLLIMPVSSFFDDVDLQIAARLVDPAASRVRDGLQQLADGDDDAAARTAAALEARLPELAALDVLRGALAAAGGEPEVGLARLRAARRGESLPDRAHERHAEVLRGVADACGARFLSADAFELDPRALALDDPLFVDQVHPSFLGNLKLSELVVAALDGVLPAGSSFDSDVDPEGLQPTWRGGWRPKQ